MTQLFLIKDKVADVLTKLGDSVPWKRAKDYLDKTYGPGHGIVSSNFYTARSNIRGDGGLSVYVASRPMGIRQVLSSEPVRQENVQPVAVQEDLTIDDMRKVVQCVRLMGGEERLLKALSALKELRV